MKILLVEPFYGGSHRAWADGLQAYSRHEIKILSLPARHWKWRMHGGAISLADAYLKDDFEAELILVSDMLDLALFKALTVAKNPKLRYAVYFHENQLSYPWSPTDTDPQLQRDLHYGFINYSSACVADACFFNSQYHLSSFLEALSVFLDKYPDPKNRFTLSLIKAKSKVLHLGVDLQHLERHRPNSATWHKRGLILWNHRWEYDKNPEAFFRALINLQQQGIDFRLVVLGERNQRYPSIFDKAKELLADKILHWGYADNFADYARWLWEADILPVSSIQDFFGQSIIEAVYCNVKPLLPRRLAYPEHFPQSYLQSAFFYDEEEEFEKRIQAMLFHVSVLRKQQTKQYVSQYDWLQCIEIYDKALEQV